MQKRRFSVILSKQELILGLCFLPLYLRLLSLGLQILLRALLGRLPTVMELNACYYGVCILAILLIFHRFLRENLRPFAACRKRLLIAVPATLIAYFLLSTVVDLIILSLQPGFGNRNNDAILGMMGSSPAFVFLLSVLLAPVIEETLFRGLIFGSLRRVNRLLAYTVTALGFSAIHVVGYLGLLTPLESILSLVQYLPATLVLCAFYEYFDTIYAPMLLHAAINLIAFAVMGAVS